MTDLTAPPERRCSVCGEWKPESEFAARKERASGFRGQCNDCVNAQRRANRVAAPTGAMLSRARSRAKAAGVPFSITAEDISVPSRCPVLHIPLDGRDHNHRASLDRIIPERGYVPGNVIVISQRANLIKNNATPEELHDIAEFVSALTRGHRLPRRTK